MRILVLIFLSLFYSCKSSAQKTNTKETNSLLFGKIQNDSYEYVIDTLSYKKSISNSLFSEKSKTETYNKIEIRKSKTLGEVNEEYYYLVLYHFDKKLKTARFLENRSGYLYLNNDSVFNSIYNSCVGEDDKCFPNVVIDSDLNKAWICSDEVGICSIDANECKSVRSIIQD